MTAKSFRSLSLGPLLALAPAISFAASAPKDETARWLQKAAELGLARAGLKLI